jgi:hypothetical protein
LAAADFEAAGFLVAGFFGGVAIAILPSRLISLP